LISSARMETTHTFVDYRPLQGTLKKWKTKFIGQGNRNGAVNK
jgi:hypothetical protein